MDFISTDAGAVVAKCQMDKLGLPDFISATVVHCRALLAVVDEVPILFALIVGLWREMYTTSGKLRASGSLCRSYKTPSRVSPSIQPANHLPKRSMAMFSCKSGKIQNDVSTFDSF